MSCFEVVSKFENDNVNLPERKTADAAAYDIEVLEDTLIPPYNFLMNEIVETVGIMNIDDPVTLKEMADITKQADARPTLVPTGIKACLDCDTYLELVARSSTPLKHWLMIANAVGVIDGDYYNNPDNEGHIYFQVINMSPMPIILKKGDVIGQGIIKPYLKADDDNASGVRTGGFGSTTK